MKRFKFFLFFVFINLFSFVKADSPMTSPIFYTVYESEAIVKKAQHANGVMTDELMEYIANESNPIALKLAIINVLNFDMVDVTMDNYCKFLKYLKQRYDALFDVELYRKIDASTMVSLAYLRGVCDYMDVEEALKMALIAREKDPESKAISIVIGLIKSQKAFLYDDNWCNVWVAFGEEVFFRESNDDFDLFAVFSIAEYIDRYAKYCP